MSLAQTLYTSFRGEAARSVNLVRRVFTPGRIRKFDRLHLGAGSRFLPGWGNVDLRGLKNMTWDLTVPLPLPEATVRYIYSEHFIEHIPREACRKLFVNARRALAADGVMRISTPDLAWWAQAYLEGRVIHHEHSQWYPETPCQTFNEMLHNWGHQLLYDEAELRRLLAESGFTRVSRVSHRQSVHEPFREIESRPDCGDLIVEAQP